MNGSQERQQSLVPHRSIAPFFLEGNSHEGILYPANVQDKIYPTPHHIVTHQHLYRLTEVKPAPGFGGSGLFAAVNLVKGTVVGRYGDLLVANREGVEDTYLLEGKVGTKVIVVNGTPTPFPFTNMSYINDYIWHDGVD